MASLAAAAAQIVTVPASFAHAKDQANTTARGFKVRVVQASNEAGTLQNSVARAEAQLAGTLVNPVANKPFDNVADKTVFGADGYYRDAGVIDYEKGGAATAVIPGIPNPSTPDYADNIAMEAIAYLDLAAGDYTMGVNSDDGFRVTVGWDARDQFGTLELGIFDAGRGAADSTFQFKITQAGLYSFRLVYFQGNGGANVSWFMGPSDNKVLINDPNISDSVKAYQSLKTPEPAFVQVINPQPATKAAMPNTTINGILVDGETATVVTSSIELYFDSAKVDAAPVKAGNRTTFGYKPTALLKALSVHSVKLVFADSASNKRTNDFQFTVAQFGNVTLPAPFYLETFDKTAEGELPAGWTVENYTDPRTGGLDLDDPNSDSYMNWVVISRDRVIAIGAAGKWEAQRRLNVLPGQFVNGQEVTSLVSSNFLYAESDQRGGSQVQYAFSPDINCTGKSNVFLSFHNIYEQNQDSLGAVEYSIDAGITWQPILYMLDGTDIIKDANGAIDGYATMIRTEPDTTASLKDPNTGEEIGLHYGAFIGVTSNRWSTLAPYISARVNDDAIESKRVELFRLPLADNQAKVRLRFAQAGTGSWYFGVDDVGLYTINLPIAPKITKQSDSQMVSAGNTVVLSVTVTGDAPLAYQWQLNGAKLAGQTNATLTLANVQASSAGTYGVVVSNEGGEATSTPIVLEVFSGTISQDMVVHLAFDNNFSDTSGKSNNGAAIGSPTFSDGKIGKAVHIPSGQDYVSLGTPADLNFGASTDFSISLWAKLTAWGGDPSLIGNKNWNSGGNQGYVLATDGDGHFQWNLAGPPGSRKDYDGAPGFFTGGAWHNVVVTFKRSGSVVTYLDGLQVDSRSMTANQNNLDTPASFNTNIGQDGTGTYGSAFTDADIDDVAIWRRIVTPQEVASIYTQGLKGQDVTTATGKPVVLPPSIATQPISQTASVGGTASLKVVAGGTAPYTYRWQKDGADLAGATSDVLTLTSIKTTDAANYQVIVGNDGGTVTSQPVRLAVFGGAISQDLVTHLKFDGDYSDSSGRGNNAAAVGKPGFAAGKIGQAFSFTTKKDGSDFSYATLGAPADLLMGDKADFSVSMWVNYSNQVDDPPFISNKDWNSSNNKGWGIFTQGGGNFRVNVTGPGGSSDKFNTTATPAVRDGTWHLITTTFWRGTNVTIYVDGQLYGASSFATAGSIDTADLNFKVNIGQDGSGAYTDGGSAEIVGALVDDLGIWRRVLTQQEVAGIYSAGAAGKDLSTVVVGQAPGVKLSFAVASGKLNLTWTAAPGLRLQKSALATGSWTDVAGTDGAGSASESTSAAAGFYRLYKP